MADSTTRAAAEGAEAGGEPASPEAVAYGTEVHAGPTETHAAAESSAPKGGRR